MTRNDVDVLRLNVVHHLQTCCDRILVVDNGSSDKSRAVLKRLAKKWPVDWTVDDGDLRQGEIVTELAHEARAKGADWVMPLDTDEFWHGSRPIHEIVAEVPSAGAIEVPRIEFIQARDQKRESPRSLQRVTMRVEHPLLGDEAITDFLEGRRSMFETAPQAKQLFRPTPGVVVQRGAHVVDGVDGDHPVSGEIAIFHAPLRSSDALWKRAEQGRRIARVTNDPNESYQNRYWLKVFRDGRMEEAWRAHSYEGGALDVGGRKVELVEDGRLAEILAPKTRSRTEEVVARLAGRAW